MPEVPHVDRTTEHPLQKSVLRVPVLLDEVVEPLQVPQVVHALAAELEQHGAHLIRQHQRPEVVDDGPI